MKAENEDTKTTAKGIYEGLRLKICEICFDKGVPMTNDEGHKFISCSKCKINVHKRCYGESNPIEEASQTFICEKCALKKPKPKVFLI